jgi:ABC-2 type transport system ATP-binding protein
MWLCLALEFLMKINTDKPIISIGQLSKRFGTMTAVDRVDLVVSAGEIHALLGPNGAGKSTTLNCVLGFLQPDAGHIEVAGFNTVTQKSDARAQLAYIPEQVALYPQLTGYENLNYLSKLSGHTRDSSALTQILERVQLQPAAIHRRVSTYSKGMRQKVGIAVALAKNAKALILDEPTSGLDPSASYEFSQLIKELAAQGAAILMATHDLFRAQEDAHRISIYNGGKIVRSIGSELMGHIDLEQVYLQQCRETEIC